MRPIEMAQEAVRRVVKAGECVVDATIGNGHDTLFLCELVGECGKVIGFDVQATAVASTRQRVEGVAAEVCLHACGHEEMAAHVEGPVAAVMFNLGYLPRADKAVITTAETTLPALQQALELLRSKGVISVMCYPGHEGGGAEAEAVVAWAGALDRSEVRVLRYEMVNAPNHPAFLLLLEKQ
ncbi:class I SAM-dependent methyltransferase [Rubritalea tangerina]|uniref:Class I SAM-dependent methyltransferase n=2 Tax=Rubritalea tangerina TaxID=430798 RepID=A0ABW4ZEV0_9BACT